MGQKEVKINSIEGHFQFQNISTKEKLIQVVFKDINRIYGVNVNISNMNKIQSILNKFFCFPIELKINIVEQITDNFQIVLSIENSENYIVDIDIIEIKHNKIEHQSFKFFNFFPLKFLLEKNDKIIRNRLFRGTDSLFSDPLDYEKSLEDYELKGKNILLLVYDIKETDYIQVNIALKGQKIVKNCDKYMRIKELEGMLVKEIGVFHVLCSLESGLKIEESNTLAMIENGDKILNFVGVEFEEYYRVFNYANEIKKELIINENKNLIDLPD